MITQGAEVEIHALRQQGWSISAIARHLELDRKTVRAYLAGDQDNGRDGALGNDVHESDKGFRIVSHQPSA